MRHWMLSIVVLSMLISMVGCKCHPHMHGICDCDYDDHCVTRAPWLRNGGAPVYESIPAPATKLPEVKTKHNL
jgi:hypothetical protein